MDLTNQQIKDTYGNVLTIGTTAGSPTTGTLQNGEGLNITSFRLFGDIVIGSGTNGSLTAAGDDLYLEASGDLNPILKLFKGTGAFNFVRSGATTGVSLFIDNNHILAQRNGTNAQTFNIYNTYTDGSNYERGFLKWDTNLLKIGTEALGTGTDRDVQLGSGSNGFVRVLDRSDNTGLYLGQGGSSKITLRLDNLQPFLPATMSLGDGATPWKDIFLRPSSSLTPNANGDLVIEATNNTTLTFKYKGSDGVVRSGTVALS